ncbi:MAG: hypothetical protein OEY03_09325 [Rhizobacter sp.]|nr:hypothetical protein [Rhizobacter sp.]
MSIEWGVFPNQSNMSMFVHDNTGAPGTVLDAGLPFDVHVSWVVPDPINDVIGGNFRVRVYAESIGPGQEQQVGGTQLVPAVPNQTNYAIHVNVPGGTLRGEGEAFGGQPVSGMYKFVAVLQHMNPGPNQCSGYGEGPLIHLRTP